ncbi:hypothetical protein FHG87_021647 [Trinorchestia longiramus]|nr:hypothetical protein FHG87_021647 [Trinorchestia longiramus]
MTFSFIYSSVLTVTAFIHISPQPQHIVVRILYSVHFVVKPCQYQHQYRVVHQYQYRVVHQYQYRTVHQCRVVHQYQHQYQHQYHGRVPGIITTRALKQGRRRPRKPLNCRRCACFYRLSHVAIN